MNGSGYFLKDFFLHLWLVHVDVWHRPAQYIKAIILQLKTNILKYFFLYDPFLKSLLSLLQYCFCFMFWFFGCKLHGILAPKPRIEPVPTVKGNVLTTGPPGNPRAEYLKVLCSTKQENNSSAESEEG